MIANIIRNAKKTVAGGDPYYSAVSLLLPMDGTNGSTTFTDSSLNGLTVTAAANAQISTTQVKYGSASGYFDGTGDSLTIPANTALALGAGDYTIEGWFYSLTSGTSQRGMIDFRTSATGTNGLMLRENDGGFLVYLNNATLLSTTTGRVANQWQHVALVRKGTTVTLYVDGVSQTTGTSSTNLTNNIMRISGFVDTQSNPYAYNGYIDDLRISKFARYTSNFTPPTAALPTTASSTPADPYYGYTSLLLHMDGSNASTNFVDSGPNALTVTASGDAKVSTGSPYFGTGAAIFDGSGDFLSVPSGTSVNFGTGDFTVEMWARYSSLGFSNNALVSSIGPTVGGLYFAIKSNLTFLVARAFVANDLITAAVTWPANTWAHIALSRSGSTMRVFKDGVLVSSVTNTQNYSLALSGNNDFAVGATQSTSGVRSQTDFFNGQIDDLRITKGVSRYNSNFTPPTKAYPNVYNPYASLPVNGAILWLDASKHSSLFTDAGSTNVKNNGDLVYQWNDLSGANNHATQSTSGSRPTWSPPASGQNGLGAIRFNRADSQWMMDQMASVTIGSIYFVYYHSTGNALYSSFIASSTAAGPLPASDIEFRFAVPAGNYDSFVALHSHNFSSISSRINNSAVISNFYNYIYGQGINTSNTCQLMSFAMTPKSGSMNLVLGQDAAPLSGRFSNMELCEIVMFPSQHSQEQIDLMESYLKTKWRTP
jgi:hypothetical protein